MIISFVVFITFVVFIYSVIKPSISTGENKQTTLEYIEKKITENVSDNLTTVTVNINTGSNPDSNCINLNSFIFYSKTGDKDIIKNSNQVIQPAYVYTSGASNYLRIERASKDDAFFKVYYSQKFPALNPPGGTCDSLEYDTDYVIGSITTVGYLFKNDVIRLKDYYDNHYEKLKSDFKVPPGNEFGFDFVESDGTTIKAEQDIGNVNVFADEFPIQYVDEQANILSGFINMKVW